MGGDRVSTRQTTETKIRITAHMQLNTYTYKRLVKVGDVVKQGQVIGKVGNGVSNWASRLFRF